MTTASLLLALACKKTPPQPAAQQEHTQPGVYLLDAGSGPTQALRYATAEPSSYRFVNATDMYMGMTVQGIHVPMDMPPFFMTMQTEVTPTEDGGFHVDGEILAFELGPSELPDHLIEELSATNATVAGSSLTWTTSAHGQVLGSEFDPVPGADPGIVASIERMDSAIGGSGLTFPEQPVGVGARWEEVEFTDTGGLKVRSHTFATLVERDGSIVVVATEVVQVPLSDTVELDSLPEGTEARLADFASTASGQFTIDLREPGAATGEAEAHMTLELEIRTPEEPEWAPMTTEVAMKSSYWIEED